MIMMMSLAAGTNVGAPRIEVENAWQLRVLPGVVSAGRARIKIPAPVTLLVSPAESVEVKDERYDELADYNPTAGGWMKGTRLHGLITVETTAAGLLDPNSVVLKPGPGDAVPFRPGADYALEGQWATVGRLPNGAIEPHKPIWADYRYGLNRIDTITVDRKGHVFLVRGTPHNATPHPPDTRIGEVAIANIWVPGRLAALSADNIYPILEPSYPEPKRRGNPPAADLLPKTWAKLHSGKAVNVLAWGDSVTAGGQASDVAHQYQSRFVTLLQQKFPASPIHLTTLGWGGRATESFLKEPPGAPYNFQEKVLDPHPDLIVMEFVNDAYLTPAQVEERYSMLLHRFQEIGAEWVILTPHYVRPDWMGAANDRVESDPRPYVAGVRAFAAKHHVALADASLRWGHLVKEGIPYTTLLCNSINHPDDRGHEMFARSLMELFQ